MKIVILDFVTAIVTIEDFEPDTNLSTDVEFIKELGMNPENCEWMTGNIEIEDNSTN